MAGPEIFVLINAITFQIFIPKNLSCNNEKGNSEKSETYMKLFLHPLIAIVLSLIIFEKKYGYYTYFSLKRDLQINESK